MLNVTTGHMMLPRAYLASSVLHLAAAAWEGMLLQPAAPGASNQKLSSASLQEYDMTWGLGPWPGSGTPGSTTTDSIISHESDAMHSPD